jgi:hypothetical protein
VSDGFSFARDSVTGLRVENRLPVVQVESPRTNDVALEDTAWPLAATAVDVEDGSLDVAWSSSRDGVLTTNTVLSLGTHTLTASATDSDGASGSARIPVKVVAAAADCDLTIDSLGLSGTKLDYCHNWLMREHGITPGKTNIIACVVRNSGIAVTGSLHVAITPPGGTVLSWSTNAVEFAPFSVSRFLIAVVPDEYGLYSVSATVTPDLLPDRNSADNHRRYETFTEMPAIMMHQNQRRQEVLTIVAGYYDAVYYGPVAQDFDIYNGGSAALTVTNVAVHHNYGGYPPEIYVNPAVTVPFTLQPGELQTVTVKFRDNTDGRRDAFLHVDSNDPQRPHLDAPLYCWVKATNAPVIGPWSDVDDDLLPNYVEEMIGTSTNNPDSDGDGIIDGFEDYNGNGVREAWETSPLNADTDGDGLADGEEDRNHNGGMDSDESSPLNADTDGDSLSDYDESITHTYALDPESCLVVGSVTEDKGSGETVIKWQAENGVQYRIEVSTDYVHWTPAPTGGGDDYRALRTAEMTGWQTYRCTAHAGTRYRIVVIE